MTVAGLNTALGTSNPSKALAGPRDWIQQMYVSDPIVGGPLDGHFRGMWFSHESSGVVDGLAQVRVRLMNNAGTVDKATLIDLHAVTPFATYAAHEFGAAGVPTQRRVPLPELWDHATLGKLLTPADAVDGDRVVIEIGMRIYDPAGTTRQYHFTNGDPNAEADASEVEGVAAGRPWFEFSVDLFASRARPSSDRHVHRFAPVAPGRAPRVAFPRVRRG